MVLLILAVNCHFGKEYRQIAKDHTRFIVRVERESEREGGREEGQEEVGKSDYWYFYHFH